VWENNKSVNKGFKTRISLTVKTSTIDKAGDLLVLGGNVEAIQVSGPNPYLSKEMTKKNYLDCLKIATSDAKLKANELASSLDRKLGEAIKISEGMSSSYQPQPRHEMMMAKSMDATPDISLGKSEISVQVQVQFKLK
jgi:uncharacterized protein YggE